MDEQELLALLWSMLPTPAYMMMACFFGIVGMLAFYYGRKKARARIKWLGVCLMFYPYLTGSDIRLLIGVGLALCIALAATVHYTRNPD